MKALSRDFGSRLTAIAALLCAVAAVLFFTSCAGLFGKGPVYSTKDAVDLPTAPIKNPAIVAYVNKIAGDLVKQEESGRTGFSRVEVNVLETSRIQGRSKFYTSNIDVTRGMLNALANEAELAGLIGHEIGHKVLHRKNQSFTAKNSSTRDLEYADWSQEREKEADIYGATLARKAGYDPYALVDVFERLSRSQQGGIVAWWNEMEATHKDFRNRAKDLDKHLQKNGLRRGDGVKKAGEYETALAPLRAIRTSDAVNEILPNGSAETFQKLSKIDEELRGYKSGRLHLPAERFIEIMDELSDISKFYGIEPSSIDIKPIAGRSSVSTKFMKEVLSQDRPIWADRTELAKRIQELITKMVQLGIGVIPGVGDGVDLYELLTGTEFPTGRDLSSEERAFSAIGVLAGSRVSWQETAQGLKNALNDGDAAKKLGKRGVADADGALNKAEEAGKSVSSWEKHTPINHGPLPHDVVQTFRGGSYVEETLSEPVELYRVFSDPAKKFKSYWTRDPPKGPLQAQIDSALPPGNLATDVVKIWVPAKTTIYEGTVAPEFGRIGGGNQIYIPKVNSSWEIP